MIVIARDIWLCDDCTIAAVNGDMPPDNTPDQDADIEAGLARLGPHLVSDDYDEEQAECDTCHWHGPSSDLVNVHTDPEYPDWTEKGCPQCKETEDITLRDNGREEFSRRGCDCCNSTLAGSFTRFAQLGEEPEPTQARLL